MKDDLRGLEYYRYYQDRNKDPYQSIIYLDDAIDEFCSILDKGDNIQNRISDLIKKLEPKKR